MCCLLTLINVTDYNGPSLSGLVLLSGCPAVLSPPLMPVSQFQNSLSSLGLITTKLIHINICYGMLNETLQKTI